MTRGRGKSADLPVVVPGGLLRMYGLGVLIVGDSGVGKSESALELVCRGHRFVTDDVVRIVRIARGRVIGRAPAVSRFFMEIRGLGIINIREIFGPSRTALESPIDLVIRLKRWHPRKEFDRLGLRFPEDTLVQGVRVPQMNLPVAPGRNIATLIEVACKVHILRRRGYSASLDLCGKLDRAMSRRMPKRGPA
jgi:HPr kinase/phosphorylase